MIDFHTILAASIVAAVGIMSPGPNFVAVTHRAVSTSRAEALALVAGIACVSAIWAAAVLFGIKIIFAIFPWMFGIIKIMGAAYLIWFGIKLLRNAGKTLPEKTTITNRSGVFKAFRGGLMTNLANPKSMAFYGSVFSSVIPANTNHQTQIAMVGAVFLLSLTWYAFVALLLSGQHAEQLYRRGKPWIERVSGGLLIVFGIKQGLSNGAL